MGTEHLGRGTGGSGAWHAVRFACTLLVAGAFAGLAVQCSASSGNPSHLGPGSSSGGSGNASGYDASSTGGSGGAPILGGLDSGGQEFSPDAFYVNDPPPPDCSDAGAKPPPAPGGTPQCPDDKNLQGCPCPSGVKVGDTAACWPGYRRNRNQGDCHDGQTTCVLEGENQPVWGPCEGYTGIDSKGDPLGSTGSAACGCFSHGTWDIKNLSPCFWTDQNNAVMGAASSQLSNEAGAITCPNVDWNKSPVQPPNGPWSADTVSADCTGYFKLCYTLKAYSGASHTKSSNDCVMQKVCTAAHYDVANQTQTFPPLNPWVTSTQTQKSCAIAFDKNGGYGEMSVDGESDECEKVNKVFHTVDYCPSICNSNPNAAGCSNCGNGQTGQF